MRKIACCILLLLLFNPDTYAANHYFTGLPITSDGWTDFDTLTDTGYSTARVIFVADDGNDGTAQIYGIGDVTFDSNGIFQAPVGVAPYLTITAAYAQVRDGYPDILLLKRGDTWTEAFATGSIGRWNNSGPSSTVRQILASYGSSGDRPLLNIGIYSGWQTEGTPDANNVIISGIQFYAHLWESSTEGRCVNLLGTSEEILFEDCVFNRNTNLVQGYPEGSRHTNIAFRRCQFIEGKSGELTAFTLGGYGVDGLLIEENLFYKPVEGNRHLYLDNGLNNATPNTLIRGNIMYVSQRSGISARAGGSIEKNLIVQNDLVLVGQHGSTLEGGIISGIIRDNVFLESVEIAGNTDGDGEWGLWLKNNDGSLISDNIWTDPTGMDAGGGFAIYISGGDTVHVGKNLTVQNNIVYGRSTAAGASQAIRWESDLTDTSGCVFSGNDIQMVNGSDYIIRHASGSITAGITYSNNRYYSSETESTWFAPGGDLSGWVSASGETGASNTQVTYTDATRTLKTYNQSLGGTATTAAFMTSALGQARYNWDTDLTAYAAINYIRAGFDKTAIAAEWQDVRPARSVGTGPSATIGTGPGFTLQ